MIFGHFFPFEKGFFVVVVAVSAEIRIEKGIVGQICSDLWFIMGIVFLEKQKYSQRIPIMLL